MEQTKMEFLKVSTTSSGIQSKNSERNRGISTRLKKTMHEIDIAEADLVNHANKLPYLDRRIFVL
jgi:hypothetical protein